MDKQLLDKMFNRVKEPNFSGWEKITDTISENDFINNANNQNTQGNEQANSNNTNASGNANNNATNNNTNNNSTWNNTANGNTQYNNGGFGSGSSGGFNMGSFINEALAVELVDIIGSAGGMMAVKAITKKRVSRAKFKASNEEKELLKQPMKAALASMQMTISNPAEALFYGILIVYGSKVGIEIVEEKFTKEETIDTDAEILETKPKRGRPRKS